MLQAETAAMPSQGDAFESGRSKLSGDYWTFFSAAFFFDAGFAVYFFLFNLFLLDLHLNERMIGLVNSAFTLGSTLITLPAGALVHQKGVRPVLAICFMAAPTLCIARLYAPEPGMQIALSFLAGAAMCLWGVGYLPAVAGLTSNVSRARGYSLIFSASIVTSAIGALVSSNLPAYMASHGHRFSTLSVKRSVLVVACVVASIGLLPIWRLRNVSGVSAPKSWRAILQEFQPDRFLRRFLICMSTWTATVGAFAAFANIYLLKGRGLSLGTVGTIFAITQALQLLLGMCTPSVLSFFGMRSGVFVIQGSAMLCMFLLPMIGSTRAALIIFVLLSALVWMGSPALYSLLMNGIGERQRSAAASMTLFCGSVASSVAIAIAGICVRAIGYRSTFHLLASCGLVSALAMYALVRHGLPEEL